jgi:predicted lactoylglutathione lyase
MNIKASLERTGQMTRMIFVNLPVADLPRAIAFYESVGATKDNRFCDDTAAMMVFSQAINVMLLTHDKFRQFTTKRIADTRTTTEVLLCLSAESRSAVDAMVDKAATTGAAIDPCPQQDYGFMYGRSFEDPDGHIWEVVWMDVEAAMRGQPALADA